MDGPRRTPHRGVGPKIPPEMSSRLFFQFKEALSPLCYRGGKVSCLIWKSYVGLLPRSPTPSFGSRRIPHRSRRIPHGSRHRKWTRPKREAKPSKMGRLRSRRILHPILPVLQEAKRNNRFLAIALTLINKSQGDPLGTYGGPAQAVLFSTIGGRAFFPSKLRILGPKVASE